MKYCLAIPTFFPAIEFGGPISSTLFFSKELSKRRDLNVLTTNKRGAGISVIDQPAPEFPFSATYLNVRPDISWIYLICRDISRADCVILNSLFSFFSICVFFTSIVLRKKLIIQPRGSLSKYGLKKKFFLKWCLVKLFSLFINRFMFIVTSDLEKGEVMSTFGSNASVDVIPNGVDIRKPPLAPPGNGFKVNSIQKNICFVGRIHQKKRVDILVNAMSLLQQESEETWNLHLIGGDDGALRDIKILCESKLEKNTCTFHGELGRDSLFLHLQQMDCLVLVSENENFGNVILESLSVNVPVVVSNNLPWRHLDKLGLGVSCSLDASEVANSIVSAASLDLELNNNGLEFVLDNYSWETIVDKVLGLE